MQKEEPPIGPPQRGWFYIMVQGKRGAKSHHRTIEDAHREAVRLHHIYRGLKRVRILQEIGTVPARWEMPRRP